VANQSTTERSWCAGGAAACRSPGFAPDDTQLRGFAGTGALRSDVVEDTIVTNAKLVHGRLAKRCAFSPIAMFRAWFKIPWFAAKRRWLRQKPGAAARHEGNWPGHS